jgi:hypothetical protein
MAKTDLVKENDMKKMNGQLDSMTVAMPGKATHNIAGGVKSGTRMDGQQNMSKGNSYDSGRRMSSNKVTMKGQAA